MWFVWSQENWKCIVLYCPSNNSIRHIFLIRWIQNMNLCGWMTQRKGNVSFNRPMTFLFYWKGLVNDKEGYVKWQGLICTLHVQYVYCTYVYLCGMHKAGRKDRQEGLLMTVDLFLCNVSYSLIPYMWCAKMVASWHENKNVIDSVIQGSCLNHPWNTWYNSPHIPDSALSWSLNCETNSFPP